MKKQTLDQSTLNCVRESLANAAANGFNFVGFSDAEVAADIIAHDDTFEEWSRESLTVYVRAVRLSLDTNGSMQ